MLLSLTASRLLLDAVVDALSLEFAIRGVRSVFRGTPARPVGGLDGDSRPRPPGVRVIVDRWILQLIQDFIESTRPADVRAFIEEAVIAYIDQLAATGPIER